MLHRLMINLKRNVSWIFLLTGIFTSGQTMQFSSLDELAGKLIRGLRSDASENIFIHTDKSIYKVGETIWFNAFLVNKVSHKLSRQSKIVFVDLVNDRDSIISRIILDPTLLKLNGSIQLPIVIQEGYYWLRGYSKNILLTDSANICVHPLYIVNPQNPDPVNPTPEIVNPFLDQAPKLEVYPEGGALIAGVNGTVAFRVTDQNNNPLDVDGYIKDNRDSVAARFKTTLPGIGRFLLFPWKTRQYTAYIKTRNDQVFSFPLPSTDDNAACLSIVGENDNSLKVLVSLGDFLYDRKTTTYILGVSRDSLCFAGVGQQMYETDIPKKNFPQGEATLLLFGENKQLLSERKIYIDDNSIKVDAKMDKENYEARDNVTLDISVNDAENHPALALLTMSVTDDSNVKYFYDGDIESVMKKPYSSTEKDLIMLVQQKSYRNWNINDSGVVSRTQRMEENFFDVHGTVLSHKNLPLQDVVVTLFATSKGVFVTDTTGQDGRFDFHLPPATDSTQFSLQTADKKGKPVDAKIMLDSIQSPTFATPLYLKTRLPAVALTEIRQKRAEQQDFLLPGKGKELKEVIVHTRIKKPVDYDEQKRISQFSRIITPEMLDRASFGSLSNVLYMIPGAHTLNGKLIIDPGGDGEPLLIMDGVEVNLSSGTTMRSGDTNVAVTSIEGPSPLTNFLNSLPPRNIDFIEVLNGPEAAFYGVRAGNGVVVIHSRDVPRNGIQYNPYALKKFYPPSFASQATFVEPDYTKKEIKKSNIPDLRSTIFWSGPVFTDDNGKATVNFFTGDGHGNYTVTIEGITAAGDIFLKKFSINRK